MNERTFILSVREKELNIQSVILNSRNVSRESVSFPTRNLSQYLGQGILRAPIDSFIPMKDVFSRIF